MIAELRGSLVHRSADRLVLDIGGVGFEVFISLNTYCRLPELGANLRLLAHLHVREDALQLFGFVDIDERSMFLSLTAIAGIGPRLAMNILSGAPLRELQDALVAGDVTRLVAIPGVGKKTAERMIVELRDKLPHLEASARDIESGAGEDPEREALSALVNLGYRRVDAERVVQSVVRAGESDLESIIRSALKKLGQ